MSPFYSFVLCVLFAVVAVAQGERFRRATSSSSSHSSSESSSGSGSASGGGGGGLRFPSATLYAAQAYAAQNPAYAPVYRNQFSQLMAQQQAMRQNSFAFPNVDYNQVTPDFNSYSGNPVHTAASVNYGPQGGYGQASAYPGGPDGLGVRIAEEFDAPSGGSFGVFSSSSSGSSDVDGKKTSFRTSTFGTDNNGRITFRTINE